MQILCSKHAVTLDDIVKKDHFTSNFDSVCCTVSSQFCSVLFHQIEVQFCFISQKMNLILSHLIEKKFDFISLKLLSFSVSFHLMKKNPILSHLMKIKSDSVSSHQKKSHSVLILT